MFRTTAAKQNEVVYWSRPVDWKNQTLTPNPDALCFMIFFDTKAAGLVVIEVPPADTGSFAANIDTVWQTPMEDAGPYGADEGAGGKSLILPPGYAGEAPDGYIAVASETFAGYALFRSNLASHGEEDIAEAAAYGRRLKVYPLVLASNPQETPFTDAADVLFDSNIPYDARFFRSLDRIVQAETVRRAYDAADLNRAVHAYRFFYPMVSSAANFAENIRIGVQPSKVFGILDTQPRHIGFTLNSDTPYSGILLDLHGGPLIIEVAEGPLLGAVLHIIQRWVADMGLLGSARAAGMERPVPAASRAISPPAGVRPRHGRPRGGGATGLQ